jgi:hypothetical protein
MYGAVDSLKTPANAGETKAPHDTEGKLKSTEDEDYPQPVRRDELTLSLDLVRVLVCRKQY